jgi:hypothetical protein
MANSTGHEGAAEPRIALPSAVDGLPPGARHTIWDEAEARDFVILCSAGHIVIHWDGKTAELPRPGWSRVVRGRRVELEARGQQSSASLAVL